MNQKKYIILLFIIIAVVITGCPKKNVYGEPIRSNLKYEKIADVLSNPANYLDKEIGLTGKITLECGSGCWFQLNDGSGDILVDLAPANFAIPQMTNKTVTVMGRVVQDEERIIIHAAGVQF